MSEAPRRVVLVGFMASGKTTVGRELATLLGWRLIDMDDHVAQAAGMSVPELFDAQGETRFRELEAKAARSLAGEADVVIASGGGAFTHETTRALLQEGAFTVHLHCDVEEILRRLGDGAGRPLARNRGIIPGLLRAREGAYARADWRVDTTHLDAGTVARRIADAFRARAT